MKMPGLGSVRIPISFDIPSTSSSSGRGIYVPKAGEAMVDDDNLDDKTFESEEFLFSANARSPTRTKIKGNGYRTRNRGVSFRKQKEQRKKSINKTKGINLSSSFGRKHKHFRDKLRWDNEFD